MDMVLHYFLITVVQSDKNAIKASYFSSGLRFCFPLYTWLHYKYTIPTSTFTWKLLCFSLSSGILLLIHPVFSSISKRPLGSWSTPGPSSMYITCPVKILSDLIYESGHGTRYSRMINRLYLLNVRICFMFYQIFTMCVIHRALLNLLFCCIAYNITILFFVIFL